MSPDTLAFKLKAQESRVWFFFCALAGGGGGEEEYQANTSYWRDMWGTKSASRPLLQLQSEEGEWEHRRRPGEGGKEWGRVTGPNVCLF